jgi:hypothetical protein
LSSGSGSPPSPCEGRGFGSAPTAQDECRFTPLRDLRWVRFLQTHLASKVDLFGDLQRVVDLDAEVPDRALQLSVAEKQLAGA